MDNTLLTTGNGGAGIGGLISIGGRGGDVIQNVTYNYGSGSSASVSLMSLPRADYARHDSGREDAPLSCLQGTRSTILAEIMSWLESPRGAVPQIYWLNGLAGIGKSTIAKTIADQAEDRKMLGASFFFSRGDRHLCDPQLVFPTIALQLAESDDAFKNVIMKAVQQDTTLGHKKLLPQFKGLIFTPLLDVDQTRRTTLIVLDAFDECEENGAAEILRLLFSYANQIPFLRILITSRPEPHISDVFNEELNHAKRVLHDIEASVVQEDIRFYLRNGLSNIPRKLRLRMGDNWVSEKEINSLVEKSGKLFVYAATSIRFISDNRVRDPRRQLRLILNAQTAQEAGASPYRQLDNLYLGVLRNSLSDDSRRDILERFQIIVGSIVLLREPLPLHSLAKFVQYEMGEIDTALYHLHSIIIPPVSEHEAPRIYHPSFRDFIMDTSRCPDNGFVIAPVPEQERRHAIRCFELLADFLKRDVADISDASLLNSEVDRFEQKVRDALSPEVQYACRHWASHLSLVELGDKRMEQWLDGFARRLIMWWIEAMSLIGSISTSISSIQEAHRWAMKSKCKSTLVTILADAHKFILAHGEVIRASALHVYESALPFTPHDTVLYKQYYKQASHSIRVLQGVESQWPHCLSSLLGHRDAVSSVAFTPDGSRLASASHDRTVRLWDAMSGAPIATLEGHSGWVLSVAFSPDGLRLASGSHDRTVRLWNAMSGAPIGTLEGHSRGVSTVTFSPDGLRLVSSSGDRSVRLWDATSGTPIGILEGHYSYWVGSVAVSPDGSRLASGLYGRSVRVWDAVSGAPIMTLEGHSGRISSVAFSPDGLRLASGSLDSSVRLWRAMPLPGTSIVTLEGHSDWVSSVAFSPDGSRLASGSRDRSVRLWDAMSSTPIATLEGDSGRDAISPDPSHLASGSYDRSLRLLDATSGKPVATLEGHSGRVSSVVFSPDGSRLASGSVDHSVRLWYTTSGVPIATLEGHSAKVLSVAFSPDGSRLASGSHDRTVRLWDAMYGTPIMTLEGHSGRVSSVAFSPDGLRLASGSVDHTVHLWDTTSGTTTATLEGHSHGVSIVAFSPDGQRLASGSVDHSVRLWDTTSGAPIVTLEGHSDWVLSVAFSPDGLRVASGSVDRSVRLWDAMSGVPITTLEGHSGSVLSIAFSIDAQILFSGTRTEMIAWDLTSLPPCRLDSKSSRVSHLFAQGLLPHIWSFDGRWLQVQHPLKDHVRRICYIPPFYTLSTAILTLPVPSTRIVFGCQDGRIVILDIDISRRSTFQ